MELHNILAGKQSTPVVKRDTSRFEPDVAISDSCQTEAHKASSWPVATILIAVLSFGVIGELFFFHSKKQPASIVAPVRPQQAPEIKVQRTVIKPYLQSSSGLKDRGRMFIFPPGQVLGDLLIFDTKKAAVIKRQNAAGTIFVPPNCTLGLKIGELSQITAEQLGGFGPDDLKNLELDENTIFTDTFMKAIGNLTGLESLTISQSEITDNCLNDLNKLTHLNSLSVSKSLISGKALANLKRLRSLRLLEAAYITSVSPLLGKLEGSKALLALNVTGCHLTDDDLKSIATLYSLKDLCLRDNSNITDEGFAALQALPNLKKLDIRETSLTARCAETLRKMPPLYELDSDQAWSDGDFKLFAEAIKMGTPTSKAKSADHERKESIKVLGDEMKNSKQFGHGAKDLLPFADH